MRLLSRPAQALAWISVQGLLLAPACQGDPERTLPLEPAPGGQAGTGQPGPGGVGQAGTGSGGRAPTGGEGGGPVFPATGGREALGGAGNVGGETSSPGYGGVGGRATSLEPLRPVVCTIDITRAELSPIIPTVGVIEFETDWRNPDAALVQFGSDGFYELEAPVDLDDPSHRTLLLGQPPEVDVHFRVVLLGQGTYCESEERVLRTGALPADGPPGVTPKRGPSSAEPEPGFIVTSTFTTGWVVILDHRGRVVWSYRPKNASLSRARLSYDGKAIYARNLNLSRGQEGLLFRIALDGSDEEQLVLPGSHHDFTVLPDGGLAYLGVSSDSPCDSLYIHPPGRLDAAADRELFRLATAFPSSNPTGAGAPPNRETCHANSIHYHPADGSFTASELRRNAYVKVSAQGELKWVLGSNDSTFTGGALGWSRQHGHHLLSANHLLIFNNGTSATNNSRVFDIFLDHATSTAELAGFSYDSQLFSAIFGDVQRLPGGNTLMTISSPPGVFHEVDPAGELVQTLDLGQSLGYANFRPTLYGPPLR